MFRQADHLAAQSRVSHGFFGRRGGVSTGLYASLNGGRGTQDDPHHVGENLQRVCTALGADAPAPVGLYQIHGSACVQVTRANLADMMRTRPQADALVTDEPGIVLSVLTADCAPVLLYGEKPDGAPVIGAAHAGWGGALKGVIQETVRAMAGCGASTDTMMAAIGPHIMPQSYEVGADFFDRFMAVDASYKRFFTGGAGGKYQFDLGGFVQWQLAQSGVGRIAAIGDDTYAMEDDYFSYRRSVHRQEPDYGRQVSAIMIRSL